MTENQDETALYEPEQRDRARRQELADELSAGDRVGPHRIVRPLGKGGMGEVYEAFDERLQRPVALKRIKPASRHGQEVKERFRREALAVARLRHSAVVQVYDWLEEPSGDTWIVMELVEGRSLRQILRRGPLHAGPAARWARELVAGLAFAHQAGIVHRDLKAENVMITPIGEVKILDFGLAKHRDLPDEPPPLEAPAAESERAEEREGLSEATSGLTAVGQLVGTVSAMSPEQAMGDSVDHRSDLFAIGSLLYEMLTGRSPFKVAASLETLTRICTFHQLPVRELEPEVPAELSELVDHLLQKNPDARPQSAVEVVGRLDGILASMPSSDEWSDISGITTSTFSGVRALSPMASASGLGAGVDGRAVGGAPGTARRLPGLGWVGVLGVVLLSWLAGLLAWRSGLFEGSPDADLPVAPLRVVILPFETLGEEPETFFAAGLGEELGRRLTRVEGLALVSSTSAALLAAEGLTLKEVGEALDCDFVIEGSVFWSVLPRGEGRRVQVSPRLVRIEDESTVWNGLYERRMDDLLGVQAEIARGVVEQLRPTLTSEEAAEPEGLPTESSTAYFSYLRGLELSYQPGFHSGTVKQAATLFERAVTADPSFFEPWPELVHAHARLYLNGFADPWRRSAALDALRKAEGLRPDSVEVRLARADFLYRIDKDFARSADILEQLESEQPHNARVVSLLGYVQRRQGRLREAVGHLEHAFALDGANAELASQVAGTFRAMRDFRSAQRWNLKTLEVAPDATWTSGQYALGLFYLSGCDEQGQCSTAEARRFLEGDADPDHPDLQYAYLQLALYETHQAADRRAHLEALLARLDTGEAARWRRYMELIWRQMWLERELGRPEKARELAEYWQAQMEKTLAEGTDDSWAHALLALSRVFLGDTAGAIEAAQRSIAQSHGDRYSGPRCQEWLMVTRMLAGQHAEALDLLEHLVGTSYQLSLTRFQLRLDPFWDPVREDPRFLALMEQ